jgi:2'-5' RNA ligase
MVDFIRNIFAPEKRLQYSVAALLDDEHNLIVREIWQELDTVLGIKHPFDMAIPHITHIQASELEEPDFYLALDKFAQRQTPFIVRTVGLGVFTGEKNALYISVVRNPELTAIQTNLITSLASSMEGILETHFINQWIPHISLMIPDMGSGQIGRVIDLLAQRDFTWEFRVRQLIVLDGQHDSDKPPYIVELIGG